MINLSSDKNLIVKYDICENKYDEYKNKYIKKCIN